VTYRVSPSPGQTHLREAVAMAMRYKNDDILQEPADYVFDQPMVFGDIPFGRIQIGGRLRNHGAVRWLFSNIKDRPLLVINADRGSYFHDFTVVGANAIQDDVEPSNNPSDYLLNGITHDRYGGHIGIAIDHHAKAGSWGTTLERVFTDQCGTGWAVTPAGNTLNASGLKFLDCGASHCNIMMSWGQSQSRANYIERFTGSYSRLAFTGLVHGLQQGVPPIIDGFEGSWIHTLGHFSSRFGQTLSWNNMWAERIKGIVHWMGRGSSGCIRNSTFVVNMANPINPFLGENNGKECICETHAPFTFDNCQVSMNPRERKIVLVQGQSGLYEFRGMPGFSPEYVMG
jgi:hypothetical protein